jgi:formylmethanofuran dehydrogenase subunit B
MWQNPTAMKILDDSVQLISATCPACGLLCDDLRVSNAIPISVKNGCPKSQIFFTQAVSNTSPSMFGVDCDLNAAVKAAAKILHESKQPLFAGLGTEVQGMRSVMALAEKAGATLDHMHSESTVRNTLAMQNSGWQTTTLTEVKNRADLIVAIGTDIVTSHPRFFEKLVWNADTLFNKATPEVIFLAATGNTSAGISPDGHAPTVVTAETADLPAIMSALNALALNKTLDADHIAGVSLAVLQNILVKIKAAKYAVIVWSVGSLKISHAELTVQSITQLIATLNENTRVTGLPLNSGDGDSSVNNTSAWLSGYPTRSRFNVHQRGGEFSYDTYHFSTQQQLNHCDALLWISTFNAYAPPRSAAPTIVIGHPNMQFTRAPDIFIPAGIPGLNQAGTMFRMDSSVALPLKALRKQTLPTLSDVLRQIETLLP